MNFTGSREEVARLGMAWLTLLAAAMGQAQAQSQPQTLEDVVVSASRAAQRSFDTPAAIQTVDRSTIEAAGPQVNLSESLNRVPGLTILNRQNYAQDLQLSIRGFGARSAFGIRGVRLLVDGIPATTPDGQGQGSSISLTSAERIEVLRGPLALLYGNSSGGVIQAFTREAPAVPQLSAQVYSGSFGMERSDVQYAARINDYGLVADFSSFDTRGYRSNSQAERKQFNSTLSFDTQYQTHVKVVLNDFDMPLAQDPLGLTTAQLAANAARAGTSAIAAQVRKITHQLQLGTSATQTLDANNSITARVYYGNRTNLQFQANNLWVGLNRDYYGSGLQFNQKTLLADKPVQWVAGYEYDYSKERRQGGAAPGGQQNPGALNRDEDNLATNSDFFAQATTRASELIDIVTGLRASTVRFNSADYFLSNGNGSGAVSYRATSPVLGLTVHASDELNVYANFGHGFETPSLAEVAYSSAGAPSFNSALNASKSRHYEIGGKWAPNANTRLDLSLYQIESTNEIVVAVSSGGSTAYKNAPQTSRSGWELSGSTWFTPRLRATLAASGIDARYTQAFTSGTSSVRIDNKIPGIPQSFLFAELLWTEQKIDPGKKTAALGGQWGVEFTRAGRLYANDTNTAAAEGYSSLNLKASYISALGIGSLTTYARIDNLTDRRYVGSVIVNQAASQFYEPAPGRNGMLGLKLVFAL